MKAMHLQDAFALLLCIGVQPVQAHGAPADDPALRTAGPGVLRSSPGLVNPGTLTLKDGDDLLHADVIDPALGFAYFGTWTTPAKVIRIDLRELTFLPLVWR